MMPCWPSQVSERFKATDIGQVSDNKSIGVQCLQREQMPKLFLIKSVDSKYCVHNSTFGDIDISVQESVYRNQSANIHDTDE